MADIVTEEPHFCKVTVYHGETWYDPIPQLVDVLGAPYSLVGKTMQMFLRPTYDYEDAIEILSSAAGSILFEDAANGMAAIFMDEADVATNLPVGTWEQFLRLGFTDGLLGDVTKLVWRGPLIVRAGRTDA